MSTIQYSPRSGRLPVHKLFTSYIRRCPVSCAGDCVTSALSAVLRVFSFQFSLLFFHISVASQHSGVWVLIRKVGHQTLSKNLRRYRSWTKRTAQENDFEFILTVKTKTRHPVKGSFGSEFPAICFYFVVMAAWIFARRWHFVRNFCVFLKNDSLR